MKKYYLLVVIALLTVLYPFQSSYAQNSLLLENLLRKYPSYFKNLVGNPKYKIQIVYTEIERDSTGHPSFIHHGFNLDTNNYFYPASTIKLPVVITALEKLNQMRNDENIPIDINTPLKIEPLESGYPGDSVDTSNSDNRPTIGTYIKRILLVSDNNAYNRLFEFIGRDEIHGRLMKRTFKNIRVIHRLAETPTPYDNKLANAMVFCLPTGKEYFIPERVSEIELSNKGMANLEVGCAYIIEDKKIDHPLDFTYKNNLHLLDLTELVKRIIFREFLPDSLRFDISEKDYQFLEEYMSKLPQDSHIPTYNEKEYPDWFVKFCLPGVSKVFNQDNIRIFNKAGQAYGFTIDGGYFLDYDTGRDWLLYAVIYTNENEILNDDEYEYETVAFPFFENLTEIISRYEKEKEVARTRPVAQIIIDQPLDKSNLRVGKSVPVDIICTYQGIKSIKVCLGNQLLIHTKNNPAETNKVSISDSFTPERTGENTRFRVEVYDKYGHIVGHKVIRLNVVL